MKDLKVLATYVNAGNDCYGCTFKLTANIDGVDFHIGTSNYKFAGTLDGDGKTITVNYSSTTENCALFNFVDGATIKNLTVNGSITTSAKCAAGIAAHVYGTTNITNCVSSVEINSTVAGDGTHGGFVGVVEDGSTTTITDSIFDGKLLGSSTDRCGGFVGWKSDNGTLNISNSIFAPTEITIDTYGSATFARNGNFDPKSNKDTLTNGYYTQAFGNTQDGTQVYTLTLPENVTAQGALKFGEKYYATADTTITLNVAEGYTLGNVTVNGTPDDDGVFTVNSDTKILANIVKFNSAGTAVTVVNGKRVDFSNYSDVYSITASQQNSTLIANAKNNTVIIAGGGENILTGGTGNDSFKFSAGGGIVTDYGIGATKDGSGKAVTANGVDIVKVDGKVSGIYFERDGNTKKTSTFTATIVYGDDNQVIVLKDIVKKPTKTGISPIYQTNDVAAATLKIWDTSGSKQAVLSAAKLKKLFHDDGDLSVEQQAQVTQLSALVEPANIITTSGEESTFTNLLTTPLALSSNKPKD